jgi:hypothetical protein
MVMPELRERPKRTRFCRGRNEPNKFKRVRWNGWRPVSAECGVCGKRLPLYVAGRSADGEAVYRLRDHKLRRSA